MKKKLVRLYPYGGWAYTPYSQSSYARTNNILGGIGQALHQTSSALNLMRTMQPKQEMKGQNDSDYTFTEDEMNTVFNKPQKVIPAVANPDYDAQMEADWKIENAYGGNVRRFDTGGWASAITDSAGDIVDNFNNSSKLDASAVDSAKNGVANVLQANTSANSLDDLMSLNDSFLYAKTNYRGRDFMPNSSEANIWQGQLNAATSAGKALGSTGNGWYAAAVGALGTGANILGNGIRKTRAANMALKANKEGTNANNTASSNIATSASNIDNANDTMNMRTFQAANGGPLSVYGGNYHTGLETIDEGGSHETNPMGGVPISITPEGEPNLAEEGETVLGGDFVFSDRIQLPTELTKRYKAKKGATFADVSKKLNKLAEERPNDPISKSTLEKNLQELAMIQEAVKQPATQGNTFASGGSEYIAGIDRNPYWSLHDDDYGNPLVSISDNYKYQFGPLTEEQWLAQQRVNAERNKVEGKQGLQPLVNYLPEMEVFEKHPAGFGYNIPITTDVAHGLAQREIETPVLRGSEMPLDFSYLDDTIAGYGVPIATPNSMVTPTTKVLAQRAIAAPSISLLPTPSASTTPSVSNSGNTPTADSKKGSEGEGNNKKQKFNPAYLMQAAPTIGSGIAALTDAFGLTNKPNYTAANSLLNSLGMYGNIGFTPKGTYLTYNPTSEYEQANRLQQNQAARRRGIVGLGNGNRSQIMASLGTQGYQDDAELAQLLSAIGKENDARRNQVISANNELDLKNAQMASAVDQYNMAQAAKRAEVLQKAGLLRQQAEESAEEARAANLSQFYSNLGALGKDINESATLSALPGQYGYKNGRGVFIPTETPKACGGSIRRKKSRR